MKKPTVSVIIPTHNRADYLTEAIESVLNQTYKDVEIIIVDDGSTDDTQERLKRYGDKIRYEYMENGGPARARNEGMRLAKGRYIAFLDSDDLYYPYKLELQAGLLDGRKDVGLVCTELSAINDERVLDELHLKNYHRAAFLDPEESAYEKIYPESFPLAGAGPELEKWKERRVYVGDVFERYYDELILSTNTVMFRRSLLEAIGFQHEPYRYFEDYDFVLRMTKSHRVAFIDVPTYKLRYHKGQISTTRNKPNGTEILIQKHLNLIEIAERHGLRDEEFYALNEAAVHKKLYELNRSLAKVLMRTERRGGRARKHLRKCAEYERREHLLWLLAHTPRTMRRISFRVRSLMNLITQNQY